MSKTFRHEPNPERVKRVQELRRSNAAGPVDSGKNRKTHDMDAIAESWDDYYAVNDADRYEDTWDEGYDEYSE